MKLLNEILAPKVREMKSKFEIKKNQARYNSFSTIKMTIEQGSFTITSRLTIIQLKFEQILNYT